MLCEPVRSRNRKQMTTASRYFDSTGRDDVLSGGARMIPITTPYGNHRVWTKRIGNNSAIKLLLLHGGPGATHEYFEGFDSFLPAAGIEYYYYDQLGSGYSDQPDEPRLWGSSGSSTRWSRCVRPSVSEPTTSSCWVSRGVGCSRSNMRCVTSST